MKKEKKSSKDLEIVYGDKSKLDISDVSDCVNSLRPNNLTNKKRKVIIPVEKKKNNK